MNFEFGTDQPQGLKKRLHSISILCPDFPQGIVYCGTVLYSIGSLNQEVCAVLPEAFVSGKKSPLTTHIE